jgi:hypothetical protein
MKGISVTLKVKRHRVEKKAGMYQKLVQKKANVFMGLSVGENLKDVSPRLETQSKCFITDNSRPVATKINNQYLVFKRIKNLKLNIFILINHALV